MVFPDCSCSSKLKILILFAMQSLTDIEENGILNFDFKFSWRKPVNRLGKFSMYYISLNKTE